MKKTVVKKIKNLEKRIGELEKVVTEEFASLNNKVLNWKETPEKWSVLECFEHLNKYAQYYVPAMKRVLENPIPTDNQNKIYAPGWMGNKFVEMVGPQNIKKSKTFKHMNPLGSKLDVQVLKKFLNWQIELLKILELSGNVDLEKNKISLEFFKLLKIKLGDALEFVVAHQERHLLQALKGKENYFIYHMEKAV